LTEHADPDSDLYRVRYHERVFTVKMPALKSLAELIRPGLLNYIEKQRQKL